ncbi:MAG TPA: hypothetical protein VIG90_04150, partial [Pedomonas sp.]|uniref:hypothetical protein n=1 Tax=Pedomonas sp. TaxID=2976421 RepID=UPI002F401F83
NSCLSDQMSDLVVAVGSDPVLATVSALSPDRINPALSTAKAQQQRPLSTASAGGLLTNRYRPQDKDSRR